MSLAVGEAEAGAVLTLDLDAVRANYRFLRDRAGPAGTAAVVKADAYGLGARDVASALCREGCETFFVAHLAEARDVLAAVGPGATVHVLNGLPPGSEPLAAELGVVPVLNSPAQIEAWAGTAAQLHRKLPAALHLDTGMARLGLALEALRDDAIIKRLAAVDLRLVLSHLASAEDAANPSNVRQLARFHAAAAAFPGIPRSLANSSGILLGPDYHFDLVRAGAALYGLHPGTSGPNPMRQAVHLAAKIMQLRELAPGDTVGYGGTFMAEAAMTAATLGLGYGDGWPRRARTAAFFEGARLPVIGRISMDTMVVDVTGHTLAEGMMVDLLCTEQTPDHLATACGTIGYEILTGLGRRFHRRVVEQQRIARQSQAVPSRVSVP